MGDAPKKLREIQGGMSMGIPMFIFLIGIITQCNDYQKR